MPRVRAAVGRTRGERPSDRRDPRVASVDPEVCGRPWAWAQEGRASKPLVVAQPPRPTVPGTRMTGSRAAASAPRGGAPAGPLRNPPPAAAGGGPGRPLQQPAAPSRDGERTRHVEVPHAVAERPALGREELEQPG